MEYDAYMSEFTVVWNSYNACIAGNGLPRVINTIKSECTACRVDIYWHMLIHNLI